MTEQNIFTHFSPKEEFEQKVLNTEEIRANSQIISGMSQEEFDQMIIEMKNYDFEAELKIVNQELDDLFTKWDNEDNFDASKEIID